MFTTVNGTAVKPAHEVTVTVPENYDHIDTVVLFKDTDQVRYTDGDLNINSQTFSTYVVQIEAQDADQIQQINFGYDQPGSNQGVTTKFDGGFWQSVAQYSPDSDTYPIGELYYVQTIRKDRTKPDFSASLRAEHSFWLQNRVQYTFKKITG